MMQAESDIPAGCVRWEYLESYTVNGPYIDTECPVSDTDVIDYTFAILRGNNNCSVFGWRWGGTYETGQQCYINVKADSYFLFSFGIRTALSSNYTISLEEKIILHIDPNKGEVAFSGGTNAVVSTFDTKNSYSNGSSIYSVGLFAANFMGNFSGGNSGYTRVYEYVVTGKDGIKKQHLVPILDPNGEPCMYDIVNKKYHYTPRGQFIYKIL